MGIRGRGGARQTSCSVPWTLESSPSRTAAVPCGLGWSEEDVRGAVSPEEPGVERPGLGWGLRPVPFTALPRPALPSYLRWVPQAPES